MNKRPFYKSILVRTTLLAWLLIIGTLAVYVITVIPFQRNILIERMNTEAKDIATSIGQVTATAIITEDYSFAVDHCIKVIKESHSILYVVITRKDGFSLIHTVDGWRQESLDGLWTKIPDKLNFGQFLNSDIVNKEVFHYSNPFTYSGIDWGAIHIGLSVERYNDSMSDIIKRAVILGVLCVIIGLGVSYYFASKLLSPIKVLDNVTKSIAEGDLSARVKISTGDELESLAVSFNKMTETLQQSQREIISSHEYTDNIIKSLNDTLIVIDPAGIIKRVNNVTLKLLNYKEEELIGQSITIIFPGFKESEIPTGKQFTAGVFENEYTNNIEKNYITKNGKVIPILFSVSVLKSVSGEVEGFVCVGLDITERKHFENALRESQARYKAIVEDQTELICRFTPEGSITFINEAFARYYNTDKSELQSKNLFSITNLDDRNIEEILNQLSFENPVITNEYKLELKGISCWQQWTIRALFDANKKIIEIQSTTRDITEKKLFDEEIRLLNINLEKRVVDRTKELAASLKEKEVMLKEIHHRVKNNLQIISSLLNLQSGKIKNNEDLELFNESQHRVKSMAMIHELLYKSKELGKIDFAEYLKKLISSLRQSYSPRKNIIFRINIKNVFLDIESSVPFGLIINELVTNSFKYAFPDKKDGEIIIDVEKTDKDNLRLIYSDNGIGIPESINIFETKTLGLRLVNILIQQLGGSLGINRIPKTEFVFEIKNPNSFSLIAS
jgi:PAS domain S-box-containing protein